MPSIETLIGKRLETLLELAYPELNYIGDDENLTPDFEHPLFFAEAKASFLQNDYAAHLKGYQVESFQRFEEMKPVVYLVGFHNFSNAMKRLGKHDNRTRKMMLSRYMHLMELFVVDNAVITNIWDKRNYLCEKGHIEDCTLRNSHLKQIIDNKKIKVKGADHLARDYYNVPSDYLFSMPQFLRQKGFAVGYILPPGSEEIIDFFVGQKE